MKGRVSFTFYKPSSSTYDAQQQIGYSSKCRDPLPIKKSPRLQIEKHFLCDGSFANQPLPSLQHLCQVTLWLYDLGLADSDITPPSGEKQNETKY